jgi:hypothetical protein
MRQHSAFSCVETQLTLCGSVLRILRTRLRTGKQNLKAAAAKPINRCNKKVTDLLLSTCDSKLTDSIKIVRTWLARRR